jgi:hypothetical protein
VPAAITELAKSLPEMPVSVFEMPFSKTKVPFSKKIMPVSNTKVPVAAIDLHALVPRVAKSVTDLCGSYQVEGPRGRSL